MRFYFHTLWRCVRDSFIARWLLLALLASAVPTLLVALPLGAILSDTLDYSAQVKSLAKALNVDALMAIGARYQASQGAVQASAGLAWLCVLLLAPWLSAMAQACFARAPQAQPLLALMQAGLAGYRRWLVLHLCCFVWLLAAVLLAAWCVGVGQTQALAAVDANIAARWEQGAMLVSAMLLLWLHFWAEATRAEYLIEGATAQPSTSGTTLVPPTALLRAWQRPAKLQRFALYLAVNAGGFTLVGLVLALRYWQSGASGPAVIGSLALSQLAVILIAWTRLARLFGLALFAVSPRQA
jgi:hypothetical protein